VSVSGWDGWRWVDGSRSKSRGASGRSAATAVVWVVAVVVEPRVDASQVEAKPTASTADARDGYAVLGDQSSDVAFCDVEELGELAESEPGGVRRGWAVLMVDRSGHGTSGEVACR
jgi:hypothetical protein